MEELTKEQIDNIVKSIEMCPVYSSNLLAIGYNTEHKVMRVIFKNKTSYIYFNVEPEIYEIISKSNSKGKTLNECVVRNKDKYKYLKLI